MLEQAQLDQWEGTDEPLFVGQALYGEIEKHIEECRPIIGTAIDPDTGEEVPVKGIYEWEADAVAPMICGREVYCSAWTPAPSAEERENAISLEDVLGAPSVPGVDVSFQQT
jgi:hypothetical protein